MGQTFKANENERKRRDKTQNERYKVREGAPLNPIASSHDDPTSFHPLLTSTPQIVSDFPLSWNTTVMRCLALALGVPPPSPLKKNRKSVRQQLMFILPLSLFLSHTLPSALRGAPSVRIRSLSRPVVFFLRQFGATAGRE